MRTSDLTRRGVSLVVIGLVVVGCARGESGDASPSTAAEAAPSVPSASTPAPLSASPSESASAAPADADLVSASMAVDEVPEPWVVTDGFMSQQGRPTVLGGLPVAVDNKDPERWARVELDFVVERRVGDGVVPVTDFVVGDPIALAAPGARGGVQVLLQGGFGDGAYRVIPTIRKITWLRLTLDELPSVNLGESTTYAKDEPGFGSLEYPSPQVSAPTRLDFLGHMRWGDGPWRSAVLARNVLVDGSGPIRLEWPSELLAGAADSDEFHWDMSAYLSPEQDWLEPAG